VASEKETARRKVRNEETSPRKADGTNMPRYVGNRGVLCVYTTEGTGAGKKALTSRVRADGTKTGTECLSLGLKKKTSTIIPWKRGNKSKIQKLGGTPAEEALVSCFWGGGADRGGAD